MLLLILCKYQDEVAVQFNEISVLKIGILDWNWSVVKHIHTQRRDFLSPLFFPFSKEK